MADSILFGNDSGQFSMLTAMAGQAVGAAALSVDVWMGLGACTSLLCSLSGHQHTLLHSPYPMKCASSCIRPSALHHCSYCFQSMTLHVYSNEDKIVILSRHLTLWKNTQIIAPAYLRSFSTD